MASRRRRTPVFLARELIVLASAQQHLGVDDTDDLVAEAFAIARRTGARLIVHDARLHLGQRPAGQPPDQFGLTRREREVVDLVAAGASNTQVATALGISPATVRKHLEHAYEKLNVSTRTAAAALTAESRSGRSAPGDKTLDRDCPRIPRGITRSRLSRNAGSLLPADPPITINVWGPPRPGRRQPFGLSTTGARARRSLMSMVCGLDLHRQQITFDAMDTASGEVWRGRVWQPDRERVRRWLRDDVARRADGQPVAMAVEGCTGWRYVVEEIEAAGFEAHLAEPADTQAARGRKHRAKTDRSDARLLRELLQRGELPESWIPPTVVLEWRERVRLYKSLVDQRAFPARRQHGGTADNGIRDSAATAASSSRNSALRRTASTWSRPFPKSGICDSMIARPR